MCAIPEIHLNSSANRMKGKGHIESVSQSSQEYAGNSFEMWLQITVVPAHNNTFFFFFGTSGKTPALNSLASLGPQ